MFKGVFLEEIKYLNPEQWVNLWALEPRTKDYFLWGACQVGYLSDLLSHDDPNEFKVELTESPIQESLCSVPMR